MKADNLVIFYSSLMVIFLLMNVFSTDSVADVGFPAHEGGLNPARDSGYLKIIQSHESTV